MTNTQQDYAAIIIRELVAEADNGHLAETTSVLWARQWVALQAVGEQITGSLRALVSPAGGDTDPRPTGGGHA
jgi:hypothetical protein